MATAFVEVGDLFVCLKQMSEGENHRIMVSDVTEPSTSVSIPIEGEQNALNLFAAIIHCDRDDLPPEWDTALDELRKVPELREMLDLEEPETEDA